MAAGTALRLQAPVRGSGRHLLRPEVRCDQLGAAARAHRHPPVAAGHRPLLDCDFCALLEQRACGAAGAHVRAVPLRGHGDGQHGRNAAAWWCAVASAGELGHADLPGAQCHSTALGGAGTHASRWPVAWHHVALGVHERQARHLLLYLSRGLLGARGWSRWAFEAHGPAQDKQAALVGSIGSIPDAGHCADSHWRDLHPRLPGEPDLAHQADLSRDCRCGGGREGGPPVAAEPSPRCGLCALHLARAGGGPTGAGIQWPIPLGTAAG
mmetsp:Transcript_74246/g.172232  ORF Transcript_74246/g.172232 Transcript_74246/m.172232 type:complete len:268 (+) Transcript_74246:436-1239(+)